MSLLLLGAGGELGSYSPVNYFTGGTAGPSYLFDVSADMLKAGGSAAGDGENIDTATDHGTAAINATQSTDANRPTIHTNSLNTTLQTASLDTTDVLVSTGMDTFWNNASSMTLGAVYKPTNGTTNHGLFFCYDSSFSNPRFYALFIGLQQAINYNPDTAANGNLSYGGTYSAATWGAFLWVVDAANKTVSMFANNATSLAATVVTGPAQNIQNVNGHSAQFFNICLGSVAHLFCHKNAMMDSTQRGNWFADVKSRYGLTAY